jgi:hypothetical protein
MVCLLLIVLVLGLIMCQTSCSIAEHVTADIIEDEIINK